MKVKLLFSEYKYVIYWVACLLYKEPTDQHCKHKLLLAKRIAQNGGDDLYLHLVIELTN